MPMNSQYLHTAEFGPMPLDEFNSCISDMDPFQCRAGELTRVYRARCTGQVSLSIASSLVRCAGDWEAAS